MLQFEEGKNLKEQAEKTRAIGLLGLGV